MQWPEPRSFDVNLETGLMTGTDSHYQKRLGDLAGLYADAAAFDALAAARAVTDAILGDTRLLSHYEAIHNPRFPGGDALAAPLEALGKLWYRLRDVV